MYEKSIAYQDEGTPLEAYVAYLDEQKRPLIILCHAWKGRDAFICEKAKKIASLGYVGFALDMYGQGIVGSSKEENAKLKKPFMDDRGLLQRRLLKALEVAKALDFVDQTKVAVLGFGFGGVCALDLARSGVNLQGAISVYGHFKGPVDVVTQPIRAKILILHGYKDTRAPMSELLAFQRELDKMGVDWQTHLYGQAMHAFVTPGVHDSDAGLAYHAVSEKRAWQAIEHFLSDLFRENER